MVISAKIESEIATLPPAERAEFLEAVGLKETGLDRLIRAGYALLHLVTYFTVGPKETRAWTITQGTKAPQAAGVIHSDFERGFIRSETIGYDDYIANGGETGAQEAGKMRLEGKDYVVADGDVMHFRFATDISVIPGRRKAANPESITPALRSMNSGSASFARVPE